LIDLPWVMMPRVERTEAVTGSTDWGSVIFYSSTCIIVSRVMLYFMQENPRLNPKIEKTARYLGLIK
jgi:hypothetical protein